MNEVLDDTAQSRSTERHTSYTSWAYVRATKISSRDLGPTSQTAKTVTNYGALRRRSEKTVCGDDQQRLDSGGIFCMARTRQTSAITTADHFIHTSRKSR